MGKKSVEKKCPPEFAYGSTDGTITTFAVVAGVMSASLSSAIETLIIRGVAAALAHSVDYFLRDSIT